MGNEEPQNYWQPPEQQEDPAGVPPEMPLETPQPQTSPELTQTPEAIDQQQQQPEQQVEQPPITWTAEEYVHLDRSPIWFVLFAIIVLGLVAVSIFLLKSWSFSILIVVMAAALLVYIRRPPRTLTYALSPVQGLYVGEKLYTFDEFKAFGLIQDGPRYSIMLIPRKRFAPGVSVFFPDDAGERIVDILGQRLPMETLKLDMVDVIVRKLRL